MSTLEKIECIRARPKRRKPVSVRNAGEAAVVAALWSLQDQLATVSKQIRYLALEVDKRSARATLNRYR